ncbi:ATP-binding protein [Streptomyces sp. NBC_00481]|uniref:ATP-binding protein n=2 Tax=Streptomyces TaxID=1883 RepID=UPI002DD7C563|nr:ATP-binding protein [Streptomyces sp. NBC_00481]WRY98285.1 ATP-binding protein [Streptomyces sp. NBC_00481]
MNVSLAFPPHPAWVRLAREAVRALLTAADHPELTDTAVLLTSETVTNAINACTAKGCTTSVILHVGWIRPARLRILVHDEAPGLPTARSATPDDECGRGMQLISFGADAWGVCADISGRGKATWFELGARTSRTTREALARPSH